MASLIQLLLEQQDLIDQAIEKEQGVINESLEQLIRDHQSSIENKVDNITTFLKKLDLEVAHQKNEAEIRSKKAKSLERLKENLEEYFVSVVMHSDKPIRGQSWELGIQKNPKSLHSNLTDTDLLALAAVNDPFIRTKTTYSLDKKSVMQAIEQGEISDNKYGTIEHKYRLKLKPAMRYLDYEPNS